MGIAIPGKTVFLIETAPRSPIADNKTSTKQIKQMIYFLYNVMAAMRDI